VDFACKNKEINQKKIRNSWFGALTMQGRLVVNSAKSAALVHSPQPNWPHILKFTCWVRVTTPSTLQQKKTQGKQVGESN
jgi:hypothetical protein